MSRWFNSRCRTLSLEGFFTHQVWTSFELQFNTSGLKIGANNCTKEKININIFMFEYLKNA